MFLSKSLKNCVQILFIFFVGVIAALFLLEIGLRLWSFTYQKSRRVPVHQGVDMHIEKPYIILCLGNSYTVGVGAPLNKSYPSQLQQLLNNRIKGRGILVINKGVVAQNTAELLIDLKLIILEYHPDLVILQSGQANQFNNLKYTNYLRRKEKSLSFWNAINYFCLEFFHESRVYKLIRIFNYDKKLRVASVGSSYQQNEKYLNAVAFIDTLLDRVAFSYTDQLKIQEAHKIFKDGILKEPGNPQNYAEIAFIYGIQGDYGKSFYWHNMALNVARASHSRDWIIGESRWIRNIKKCSRLYVFNPIFKHLDNSICNYIFSDLKRPDKDFLLVPLEDIEIIQWIEFDLKEIIGILEDRHIKLIIQDYPVFDNVNVVLSNIANEFHLPFVNNYKIFQAKLQKVCL